MKRLILILSLALLACLPVVAQEKKAEGVKLTEADVKTGEQLEASIKAASDTLNATLSASVQGACDAQSALEAIGRIRVAFLSLENAKLTKAAWEFKMQAKLECNECVVDLQAKVLKKPPKESASIPKRE